MATILGSITVNETNIYEVDSDPSLLTGTVAKLGTLAILKDSGSTIGRLYQKFGVGDTAWRRVPSKLDLLRPPITFQMCHYNNNLNSGTYFYNGPYGVQGNYCGNKLLGNYTLTKMSLSNRYAVSSAYTIELRRRTAVGSWASIANANITLTSGQYTVSKNFELGMTSDAEVSAYISSGSNGNLTSPILTCLFVPTEDLE